MSNDLDAAARFMATHARLLDRRRFDLLFEDGTRDAAVAALAGYRNDDGGYGRGLEPDLRAAESQPAGALHAFEVFEEIAPETSPRAVELCDWLASVSLADGGLPFALPVSNPAGCAPFWAEADASTSSLHITSAVAGAAHRVGHHHPAVAGHPWLTQATRYCFQQLAAIEEAAHAIELLYVLQFLDAVHGAEPDASEHLARLAATIPASGSAPVGGGAADEALRPLDFAPVPDRPLREHFAAGVVDADLERVEAAQHDDGGWDVDWVSYSPAAALEWRGYATVRALATLRANRVD